MQQKRVAVIGAGATGLVTIKALKEENIEPFCFEKTCYHGGLWRYHDDDIDGVASVMKTTIINTSKEIGAFSDFPPQDDTPNYMRHTGVYEYLSAYGEKFDLFKHIDYNKEVIKIELTEDYAETGRLKVTVKDTVTDKISNDIYDGVAVCAGHHIYPNFPNFTGQDKFKGKILHTHSLKTVKNFEDQVVIVVGTGNSGMDAAVEISSVSKQVYLSARRRFWFIPRIGPEGIPSDILVISRFYDMMLGCMPFSFACSLMEKRANMVFNHSKYNIKPKHRIYGQHPSISDFLPLKLLSGSIKIRDNIKTFVEGGVIFKGENAFTPVDAVIFATGYLVKFPFLSEDIIAVRNNKVHLYKLIFPPHLQHGTLAILGLCQAIGAVFPMLEAQARLYCQVLNGKVKLPSKDVMEDDILAKHEALAKRYVPSFRHTVQVDYIPYLDEIYSQIGAKPNLLKLLFTDPRLFFMLFFGPSLPYQYRLQGPHQWPEARNVILSCRERIYKPLKRDHGLLEGKPIKKVLLEVSMILSIISMAFETLICCVYDYFLNLLGV